jgi:5-methylcytosine-specific restriction endonuclease McrA
MSKRLSRYKWNKRKIECFERDDWKCKDCGATFDLDAHHLTRRSKGGSDDLDNLLTLCRFCHNRRHVEKQTKWTPGLNKLREEAKRDFEKLNGPSEETPKAGL